MKTNTAQTAPASPEFFSAWIGLDWGDEKHLLNLATQRMSPAAEKAKLDNTPEAMHAWLKAVEQRFGGRPVALAVETSRGPLIHIFSQYPWLHVFPINPATSARFRKAFSPSGAKDDAPDAQVLRELICLHESRLKALSPQDPETQVLDGLTRERRGYVDDRTKYTNQLTALLKSYFPQALELAGEDLTTPMALDLLDRWPDLVAIKAARPSTVRSFFYEHNVRRPETVEERVKLVQEAVALTTDPGVLKVCRSALEGLVNMIRSVNAQIKRVEGQIKEAFKDHPDKLIFESLPGAGPALAPRLAALFGADRSRFESAEAMQQYMGIAPVREKSGRNCWTHWRWHAPIFWRQTLVEWAGQSVRFCRWAAAYYNGRKKRGESHHVIIRALAFKWLRILWKCWQTGRPYDDEKYEQALERRQSPYARKNQKNDEKD